MNNWTRPNRPDLDATKTPSDLDIAWTTGFYEGEGTARLAGRTKRGFMISIPQKDPEALVLIRDWFGGSIRRPGKSGCQSLEICGDRARILAALMYERLTLRRKQQIDATSAMEFLRGNSPRGMSMVELQSALINFYEEERDSRSSSTSKARRVQRAEYYQRKKAELKGQKPVATAMPNSEKEQIARVIRIA